MDDFVFKAPTEFVFGKGAQAEAGRLTALHGKKVLLHYGRESIKKSGLHEQIMTSLKAKGLDVCELGGVSANPLLSLVREGIALSKKNGVEVVLAVGGGSVIDSAKAIAFGSMYDGDVWDFFEGRGQPEKILPVGCVLTITGAGSEGSKGCVITNDETLSKRSVSLDLNRPVFSIINPELQYSVSDYNLASGCVDIMAHAMERYFTNVKNVDYTDRLCEATLTTVIDNLPRAIKQKNNYDALAELSWASVWAQNNLLATGRTPDMAAHNIEHELSGVYNVAHGAGLAAITPSWMRYVCRHDLDRFVQFAKRVWNVDDAGLSKQDVANKGIEALENFYRSVGMPVSIRELGLKFFSAVEAGQLADRATNNGAGKLGNFMPLTRDDIEKILVMAI